MASTAGPSALSFPPATFAKLAPGPYLLAHLKPSASKTPSTRPSGRSPNEFRQPIFNAGSLSHTNGSAVVRCGDTAVVCGVRAEILHASDIPHPYRPPSQTTAQEEQTDSREIQELGLLVPNVELSTGCSPAHLPGNAPGTQAQSLSQRILSLLHISELIRDKDLKILYDEPPAEEGDEAQTVTKAYWTLYIDTLVISLDGNAFDAAWGAIVAALKDVKLPKATWNPDIERVVCSPLAQDSKKLALNGLPTASTFAVFEPARADLGTARSENGRKSWVLADPDSLEEELCNEKVTVIVRNGAKAGNGSQVLRIEKNGGGIVDRQMMSELVQIAHQRWRDWEKAMLKESD